MKSRAFLVGMTLALASCDLFGGGGSIGGRDDDDDDDDDDECSDTVTQLDPACVANNELCLGTSCVIPEAATCAGATTSDLEQGGALIADVSFTLEPDSNPVCDADEQAVFVFAFANRILGDVTAAPVMNFGGISGRHADFDQDRNQSLGMFLCVPASVRAGVVAKMRIEESGISSNNFCGVLE